MKLLSCHIENFGKFRNYDFDFADGVTCVFGENGFGKTTFAAFIKAMFYGLPDRRGDKFNERKRYFPYNGGKFGGYLRFESKGKEYRIERIFDKKSGVRDEMRVYCNASLTDGLGAVPGISLFGLDEESFIRTIFITADDVDVSSASGISAKLNNYLNGTEGENNFEAAVNKLDKARKSYKADRGSGGKISAQNNIIVQLRGEVENLQRIYDGLPAQYAAFKQVSDEIAALEKRAESYREAELIANMWATYDEYCADAAAEGQKLAALESRYPAGIPTDEDTKGLGEITNNRRELEGKLKATEMSGENVLRLNGLRKKFADGVPAEADVDGVSGNIKRLAALDAKIQAGESLKENSHPQAAEAVKEKAFKPLPYIIAAAVAALLVAGGIATVFFNIVAGIALIAVGAVALIGDAFLYLLKKIEKPQVSVYAAVNAVEGSNLRELEELIRERKGLSEELSAFFGKFGITATDFYEALLTLKEDMRRYTELSGLESETQAEREKLCAQIEDCARSAEYIVKKYGVAVETQLTSVYEAFFRDCTEHARLIKSCAAFKERAERYKREKGLSQRVEFTADNDGVSEELAAKRSALAVLNRQISEDEAEAEKLSEKQTALEEAENNLKAVKERYKIIDAAEKELKSAEQRLKDRYVAPIKNKFSNYAARTEEALGRDISMDKNFRVRFDREGELREDGHLSAGQRSVYAFCLRLALTDNMFESEKPFIIMDDPFVNLDEEHMKKVEKLIKELSEEKQIIYFYCHESRKI